MTEAKNRYRASRSVLFGMLWLILLMVSVKLAVGWTTRSLNLLALSLHTVMTGFSLLLSLLAISNPDRPMGRELYGHGKLESGLTLSLVAVLALTGSQLVELAIGQIHQAILGQEIPLLQPVNIPTLQLLGGLVGMTLILALIGISVARMSRSASLRFNAGQLLIDGWLTLLTVGGLVALWWGIAWLDGALCVFLCLLLIPRIWEIIHWQLPLLVQQTAIAPEVLAQIARQVDGVTHCHRIQSRGIVGRIVFVQMHLVLHPEFLGMATQIAEQIEAALRQRYGPIQTTFFIDGVEGDMGDRAASLTSASVSQSSESDSIPYPRREDQNS